MSLRAQIQLRREDFQLDVDFQVESEGVTALYGPSGAGKSTILRVICGLERPQRLHNQFNNETWNDTSHKIFLAPHLRPIGYVVQGAGLFGHLNVRGNLEYARKRSVSEQLPFAQVIELLGIKSFINRPIHTLSGGERQRVAIARSLLTSPKLLLLDEPLSALDLRSKGQIMPYLERLNRELKIPAIYVTHNADEVMRLADRVLLIEHGKIITEGGIHEMLTQLEQPMLHGNEVASLINAVVVERDEGFGLLKVDFSGGSLYLPAHQSELQGEIRVRVRADDVSLVLEQPQKTSILNVIPVEITQLSPDENSAAQMLVKIKAGEDILLARITRKSAESLGLEVSQKLFAQVKSVALVG